MMNRKHSAENPRQRPASSQRPRSGTALQEMFARKRETEQLRTEKNSAVAQYYDKWGRITSRFENWTTPEYYEKTDQMLRHEEQEKRKAEELERRREKLRDLLAEEKETFQRELKETEKNKIRQNSNSTNSHDVDVLQRLNSALSEQERRRREIEGKLYSRWRFGMTRDDLILESKNHHQAMAKLNWLDQQVEEQLERDRAQKEMEALEVQRRSELLREEELAMEIKQNRQKEISQLRKMLEFHVNELKAREVESKALKEKSRVAEDVRLSLEMKLQEVLKIFERRLEGNSLPIHNLRRLKVIAQEHCKRINENIMEDSAQLREIKRILKDEEIGEEKHFELLNCKFEQELEDVHKVMGQFLTMYDSEVKGVLAKQQQIWREDAETRKRLLKNLLQELIEKCNTITGCNRDEISSLIAIKENHLRTIEDLQEKLKSLPGENHTESSKEAFAASQKATVIKATKQHPLQFKSLGEQLEGLRLGTDLLHGSGDKADGGTPRFGRKKVAWC